jgi:hypothetical protein
MLGNTMLEKATRRAETEENSVDDAAPHARDRAVVKLKFIKLEWIVYLTRICERGGVSAERT